METYKVIYLKSESKSFSWNDGLFAIKKIVDNIAHLWKIDEYGNLCYYSDGEPEIVCTGVGNKGILATNLSVSI